MRIKAFFTVLLMLAACCASAAVRPNIVVEGVQMPAWVEHTGGARAGPGDHAVLAGERHAERQRVARCCGSPTAA